MNDTGGGPLRATIRKTRHRSFAFHYNPAGLRKLFTLLLLLAAGAAQAQPRFSISSDVSVLRNLSPSQKFWALGQSVIAQVHFTDRETGIATIRYYTNGNFRNNFTASARSPLTLPATRSYGVAGIWRMKEIVLGWKHFFKGGAFAETSWNLYGVAGFGLIFTNAENGLTTSIDTSLYKIQDAPRLGIGNWKRLSIDLGLGGEYPLGGNFFLYAEAQTWIHTSAYPSPWLHRNERVPLPVTLDAGLRILFGD